jgi:archaeal preflagellin peptidase FlaK
LPTFETILIPLVLLFAAAAAWGDLKPMLPYMLGRTGYAGAAHGRIPNSLLKVWLLFGVLALLVGYGWVAIGWPYPAIERIEFTEGLHYGAAVAINAGLSFALAVTLWELGLWAAGDAKVYALLAFTLPLSVYSNNYLSYFPSFALFFNTFVAMFVVLLIEFTIQTAIVAKRTRGHFFWAKFKGGLSKVAENKMVALKLIVFFLALFTFVRIGRHFVRFGLEQFMELNKTIIYVLLFMMFRPLMRLAQKPWAFAAALAIVGGFAIYAFFFDPTGEAKWELVNIGWMAGSIILFRLVYDSYLKATDEVEIPNANLRQGMILGDTTMKKFEERKQFFKEKVGTVAPDGLSEEQVVSLKEWFLDNNVDGTVFVARTIPFAPSLLIGALITVIVEGLVVVF